ncbi:MAG: response regulator [Deltaproteobacteria bacterium]|nr:response regulator [Deltaproteobacteria bacterium]
MISLWSSKKWSNAIIVTMCSVLILFIGLMVALNYVSNAQLRRFLMAQLRHDLEKRSLSVSYFYSERAKDLRDLCHCPSISDFFVNKALGMTMEYGLKSSLLEIHKVLEQLKDRKRIGKDLIYNRIVFIDKTGEVLADSNSRTAEFGDEQRWKGFLTPENNRIQMKLKKDDPYELIISVPVRFKGEYTGQIIAWVSQPIVYDNFIKTAGGDPRRKLFLVCETEDLYLPPILREAPGLIHAVHSGELARKTMCRFKDPGNTNRDMMAIQAPINNTMFSLLMTMPAADVIGFMNPWFLPVAIGLFSVAVLACMLFVITNAKNQVMNARLDEASKRKEELEKINLELEGAKQTLIEREERYRMLTGNLPGIVYRVYLNSEKRMQFFNDMLYPTTGFRQDELKYENACPLTSIIIREDRDAVVEHVQDAISKGRPFEIEYRVRHKKGGLRYLAERGRPVYGPSGEVEYNDGIILDVTEREAAEQERRNLQAQLQRAQKMEAMGTLAGGVAHDLNNILSGIVSYPELVLLRLPPDSALRKPLLAIQKSGERAAAVVQDLLTLARRGVVVTEVVNLNDVVSEYLSSPEYHGLMDHYREIEMEVHFETDLLNILGSSSHLSKTAMNLISNAAEAMPAGGKIVVSTKNQYIDKPVRGYDDVKEGDYVVFSVSDTGEGISPDDLERIFEPFYTKKKMSRSGTGLGMTVVWGTVKDHHGYIDVQSIEGKGTTFTLYFPVTREGLPEEKSDLAIENYRGKGESILVIDDVEEQRQIAFGMMKTLGYSVTSLTSGEAAIEYMKNHSADLLILDMIMEPGIDGLETYRQILKRHPGQKAIIVSGFSETDRVKEAQRLGAGAYVKKPFLLCKIGPAARAELDKS